PIFVLRQIPIRVVLEQCEMLGGCEAVDEAVPLILISRIADHGAFVCEISDRIIALEGGGCLASQRRGIGSEKNPDRKENQHRHISEMLHTCLLFFPGVSRNLAKLRWNRNRAARMGSASAARRIGSQRPVCRTIG